MRKAKCVCFVFFIANTFTKYVYSMWWIHLFKSQWDLSCISQSGWFNGNRFRDVFFFFFLFSIFENPQTQLSSLSAQLKELSGWIISKIYWSNNRQPNANASNLEKQNAPKIKFTNPFEFVLTRTNGNYVLNCLKAVTWNGQMKFKTDESNRMSQVALK